MYFPLQNTCANVTPTIARPSPDSLYGISSSQQVAPNQSNVGSVYAIAVETGKTLWRYDQRAAVLSLLSTAGGLVFGGTREGNVFALDATTGEPRWDFQAGGACVANPISYGVDGRQHVALAMGQAVFVFAQAVSGPWRGLTHGQAVMS